MMGRGMMGKGMGDSCPMALAGTTVGAEEVPGGTAMVFTTTGDVAELRRRVSAMAEKHSKHAAEGCPMMKMHDGANDAASTAPAPSAEPSAAPAPVPPAAAPAKPAAPTKPAATPKTKG